MLLRRRDKRCRRRRSRGCWTRSRPPPRNDSCGYRRLPARFCADTGYPQTRFDVGTLAVSRAAASRGSRRHRGDGCAAGAGRPTPRAGRLGSRADESGGQFPLANRRTAPASCSDPADVPGLDRTARALTSSNTGDSGILERMIRPTMTRTMDSRNGMRQAQVPGRCTVTRKTGWPAAARRGTRLGRCRCICPWCTRGRVRRSSGWRRPIRRRRPGPERRGPGRAGCQPRCRRSAAYLPGRHQATADGVCSGSGGPLLGCVLLLGMAGPHRANADDSATRHVEGHRRGS